MLCFLFCCAASAAIRTVSAAGFLSANSPYRKKYRGKDDKTKNHGDNGSHKRGSLYEQQTNVIYREGDDPCHHDLE